MRILLGLSLAILLLACGAEESATDLKEVIESLEDQLNKESATNSDETELLRDSLANTLLKCYQADRQDKSAPEYLDKLQMIYSAKRDYATAAAYADTLIENYPNYANRLLVIESQYTNYDMFIQPRDVEKARYYLEMLLKEDKKMDKQTRADFEYRLEYMDLTIEQLMQQNMTELK